MTVKIELECDACGCCNSTELDYYRDDYDIEQKGWMVDHQEGMHYCPTCTPQIKKEMNGA